MTRITVVIEDHGEGLHIGQQLAGGRVIAAMQGDHSGLLEALEQVCARWDEPYYCCGLGNAIKSARAAIAKARAT